MRIHASWRSLCVAAFMTMPSAAVLAVTGGVSVEEVLRARGGSGYTQQQLAAARAVAAVTVPLFNTDTQSLCSSTIVHPRVVLTAAHCVVGRRGVSRRINVHFQRSSARQALDVVVHPAIARFIQRIGRDRPDTGWPQSMRASGKVLAPADLALVLLHRPIPEGYELSMPVARGFRDSAAVPKIIAGYGQVGKHAALEALELNFAELAGNSRLWAGAMTGEDEIIMFSRYRDGVRVNVCSGDSGGPIFIVDRAAGRLRQLGVTSLADEQCREISGFAPIDSQRVALRAMFEQLMQGEEGAEDNPF